MYLGELIEYDDSAKMFTDPADERTKAYLTGKMGWLKYKEKSRIVDSILDFSFNIIILFLLKHWD